METISKDTTVGAAFCGKDRTVSLDRINLFSGGYPKGLNWPAKNIHTDLAVAQKSDLATRAASGAMFEGYLVDLMTDLFGDYWLTYGKMKLAFIKIVDKDTVLLPKATVQEKKASNAGVDFVMDIWCEDEQGDRVVTGTACGIFKG